VIVTKAVKRAGHTYITVRAEFDPKDWLVIHVDEDVEWELKGNNLNIRKRR